MQIDDKTVIEAIQKASKVDSIEKLLWDIKGSIKQDLQAIALQTKQDIITSNQLQIEQIKNNTKDILKEFKKEEIDPINEDINILKGDKKALKWVVISITSVISFIGSVVNFIFVK